MISFFEVLIILLVICGFSFILWILLLDNFPIKVKEKVKKK